MSEKRRTPSLRILLDENVDRLLRSHFHAEYAGVEALITIDTLDVMAGELPSRALGLVYEWDGKHRAELREAGKRTKNLEPTGKINPLE